MAASGYTPISLYYSTTPSAAPTAGNLVNGELAINIADGKLYYKDSGGSVQLLADQSGITGPILFNLDTVSSNITVSTGKNGFSVGPVTVESGYSVTVASGQRWVVI